MMQSENKWREILDNRKWYNKLYDRYLQTPIIFDFIISILLIIFHYLISIIFGFLIIYKVETLSDILNELISSSLSAVGFILTALAIIASIKQTVPKLKKNKRPDSGKSFFYNSKAYKEVIRIFSLCCVVFIFLFLFFVFLRTSITYIDPELSLNALIFGISLLTLSFLRCVKVLWDLIQIG